MIQDILTLFAVLLPFNLAIYAVGYRDGKRSPR